MWNWIKHLDRLLRGEVTSLPALQSRGLEAPVLGLAVVIDLLGLVYGLCMGLLLVVFALVGIQMGCVLRQFIGAPGQPFTWLRPKQSNFFIAVGSDIQRLVLGESSGR